MFEDFCNTDDRDILEACRPYFMRRGREVAPSPVYDYKVRGRKLILKRPHVPASYYLAHHRVIVLALYLSYPEHPVFRLLGPAVPERHHRTAGFLSLDVRDVERLDACRCFFQAQDFGQFAQPRRADGSLPVDRGAQRLYLVADFGSFLESPFAGELLHLPGQSLYQLTLPALDKKYDLLYPLRVIPP